MELTKGLSEGDIEIERERDVPHTQYKLETDVETEIFVSDGLMAYPANLSNQLADCE